MRKRIREGVERERPITCAKTLAIIKLRKTKTISTETNIKTVKMTLRKARLFR